MSKFWELFGESIIMQSVITTLPLGVVCYLWATGKPVPADAMHVVWAAVAFWMGTKTQYMLNRLAQTR